MYKTTFSAINFDPLPQPMLHHSRTVLPSNGEASSRHALYSKDAVDKRREGVGGGSADVSAASNSQHRHFTDDKLQYRTHGVHSGDIRKLSEQTATSCTVEEVKKADMSAQQSSSNEGDRDYFGFR